MKLTLAILIVASLSGSASAEETFYSAGSQAQPLNQAGGTARATAMGSAVVAVPQGSASLLWNPAALSSMTCTEAALHHNSMIGGGIQEIVVVGMPLKGKWGGIAASVNYVDHGTIDGRNATGDLTGGYTAGDMGGSLGYGVQVIDRVSIGAALRGNWQSVANKTYSLFTTDVGVLWNPINRLNLGVTYANFNLGSKVGSFSNTRGWRLGAAYDIDISSTNQLLVAAGTELQDVGVNRYQLGLEDWLYETIALRAGYAWNVPNNQLNGLSGMTAGVGFKHDNWAVDYAYTPMSDLGDSHRLSLTVKFNCATCVDCGKKKPVAVAAAAPIVASRKVLVAVTLEDTHFDFDKSTLKPSAQTILKDNIQLLKDNPKATVEVAGYASALGTDDYNQKLSERRAKSVSDYLIAEGGIRPSRISTVGHGSTRPAAFEKNPEQPRSKAAKSNMRVLFEIIQH